MKYFVFTLLFLLLACESINKPKKIKKNKSIQMEIKTKPTIKVKK